MRQSAERPDLIPQRRRMSGGGGRGDQAAALSFLAMAARCLPWWKAWASSSSEGTLEPSPAKVPAPYGLPPFTCSISNIPAPNVYPIGTKIIPWCASCVIAVNLPDQQKTPGGQRESRRGGEEPGKGGGGYGVVSWPPPWEPVL